MHVATWGMCHGDVIVWTSYLSNSLNTCSKKKTNMIQCLEVRISALAYYLYCRAMNARRNPFSFFNTNTEKNVHQIPYVCANELDTYVCMRIIYIYTCIRHKHVHVYKCIYILYNYIYTYIIYKWVSKCLLPKSAVQIILMGVCFLLCTFAVVSNIPSYDHCWISWKIVVNNIYLLAKNLSIYSLIVSCTIAEGYVFEKGSRV
jgi:hypothetical protein